MTRPRRNLSPEVELAYLRQEFDALRREHQFWVNLWALAPYARARPKPPPPKRRRILIPRQRRPSP